MSTSYWIKPRDETALLRAMMQALAGDAHISFEGNLSRCTFADSLEPSGDETEALRRQTFRPELDFVVLPLRPEGVEPILAVVLPERRFQDDIIHIQIERRGELQFGSYDNFHPDCVVCCEGVETSLLDRLKSSGVIQSWEVAPDDQPGGHG